MYPNLTPTLSALLGAALLAAVFIAVRRPFLRRLAMRQISRRRTEAILVVAGSILGSAVIAAGLVVGDTLNYSVGRTAYQHLGPVDEVVDSSTLAAGSAASDLLAPLKNDPRVDGLMTVFSESSAASAGPAHAVPRASVVEADFAQAAVFGAAGGPSGLSGATPAAGQIVVDARFAKSLHLTAGEPVTLYLFGRPVSETTSPRSAPTTPPPGVRWPPIRGTSSSTSTSRSRPVPGRRSTPRATTSRWSTPRPAAPRSRPSPAS